TRLGVRDHLAHEPDELLTSLQRRLGRRLDAPSLPSHHASSRPSSRILEKLFARMPDLCAMRLPRPIGAKSMSWVAWCKPVWGIDVPPRGYRRPAPSHEKGVSAAYLRACWLHYDSRVMEPTETRTFDEIRVGDSATLTRELARKDLPHVAALISTLLATQLPGPGSVSLSQSLRARRPIAPGDVLTVSATVAAKEPAPR